MNRPCGLSTREILCAAEVRAALWPLPAARGPGRQGAAPQSPRRRQVIVTGAACSLWAGPAWLRWPGSAHAAAGAGTGPAGSAPVPLAPPQPLQRLHVTADGVLLGVAAAGELWRHEDGGWRLAGAGVDPAAPLASGHGRVVGRSREGGLWVLEAGRVSAHREPRLGLHAGLMVLAFGVIAVAGAHGGAHPVVRLEPGPDGRWIETARSADPVLPDARPLPFDAGTGARDDSDGHVAVLAGPDRQRYRHAVLGDDVEATSVLVLDRHGLSVLARLDLPSPWVFEDIAPRPIAWRGRRALLTMRSGPQGGQLAVVAAGREPGRLELAALGEPIGSRHRWLSASTDGRRIVAVHTPHIGGILHRYRAAGKRLLAERLSAGVSNHVLGERELDISAWVGPWLVLPSQDRRRLHVFDADAAPAAALPPGVALPAPVRSLHRWALAGRTGVAVLMDDGAVGWWAAAA